MAKNRKFSAPVASAPSRRICQGPIMPIGGAESKEPGGPILERFVSLAGGKQARIAIIPTVSADAQYAGERYAEIFQTLGAKDTHWLHIEQRPDANQEQALEVLEDVTGIFITGGDQARLVELIGGAASHHGVQRKSQDRGVGPRGRSRPECPRAGG